MATSTNSCAACSPWARVARCRTASRHGWQNASGAAAIPPACCKATAPASPNWTTSTSASTNRCKERMFKPHVTVACVVHAAGGRDHQRQRCQPAGHLESGQAVKREKRQASAPSGVPAPAPVDRAGSHAPAFCERLPCRHDRSIAARRRCTGGEHSQLPAAGAHRGSCGGWRERMAGNVPALVHGS